MIFITTLTLMITSNILLLILSIGILAQHTHTDENHTTNNIPKLTDNHIKNPEQEMNLNYDPFQKSDDTQKNPSINNQTHYEFLKDIEESKTKRHDSQIYT